MKHKKKLPVILQKNRMTGKKLNREWMIFVYSNKGGITQPQVVFDKIASIEIN